ncbi:MAG: hypothetical protein OEQ53_15295 [Saprospiraceae bacterium]|nr:hypothetical protein [Saprospiraceae bacterium]
MREHIPLFIIALIGIFGLISVHQDIKAEQKSIAIIDKLQRMQSQAVALHLMTSDEFISRTNSQKAKLSMKLVNRHSDSTHKRSKEILQDSSEADTNFLLLVSAKELD